MPDFSIQEIAPGVDVALGGICNRSIISQGGSVLVVDSGFAAAEAAPLRAAAQERRKEGALYLFNTHPHGDHVYGNQTFADCPIIAHEGVRQDLVSHGEQTLANWRQNSRMAALISDVVLTPPTITFQEKSLPDHADTPQLSQIVTFPAQAASGTALPGISLSVTRHRIRGRAI